MRPLHIIRHKCRITNGIGKVRDAYMRPLQVRIRPIHEASSPLQHVPQQQHTLPASY